MKRFTTSLSRMFVILGILLPIMAAAGPARTHAASRSAINPQEALRSAVAAGDEQWDDRFNLPGLATGEVTAMAVAADGTLYAGGRFQGGIARWDGRRWHPLGQGLNDYPEQLLISGNTLYAVGSFTKAGAVTVKGLAQWDGTAWSRVSNGAGPQNEYGDAGRLYAIAVMGNDIYVGGSFHSMDGVAARNIARWDGAAWHPLSVGLADLNWEETELGDFGTVYALVAAGNTLYAAGDFDGAGAPNGVLRVNNVAAWNGASWSALGAGVTGESSFDNGTVYAMAVSGGAVYVGGKFPTAGGQPAQNIARWTQGGWEAFGEGVSGQYDPSMPVETILVDGNDVYVGGEFDYAGGQDMPVLAHWNGAGWSALATDVDKYSKGEIHALALAPDGSLYVGGEFNTIDDVLLHNIGRYSGDRWHALGQGLADFETGDAPAKVYAVAIDDAGRIYAGGTLKTAGGVPVNYIAMWDGTGWHALGNGVNDVVRAIVTVGDDVYVAGHFTQAGNVAANHIARWNRTTGQWSGLGSGINDSVYALAYSDGLLYAGGGFTAAGNAAAHDLAYWDGTQWHAFGNNYRIYEIGDQGGEVGTTVYALAVSGTSVIAGGKFQTIHQIGTDPQNIANYQLVNNVVGWDRAKDEWFYLGPWTATQEPGVTIDTYSGIATTVDALAISGADVYIGGRFNLAGSVAANNIVRWNAPANTWHALGAGVGGFDSTAIDPTPVSALSVVGNHLLVGGYFTAAGNAGARYIAIYNLLTDGWSALGSGLAWHNDQDTAVFAVAASPTSLYAGGQFDKAGGLGSFGFARWSLPMQAGNITPAGGALNGDDGMDIQFPAGAVPGDTMVYYAPLFGPTVPGPNGQSIVRSFIFEARSGGQPVTTFAQPYTLRVPYTDAELAALNITDPARLNVAYWNGTAWAPLLPCAGCSVDTANKTVIVVANHFSEFTLFGQPVATPPPGEPAHQVYLPAMLK